MVNNATQKGMIVSANPRPASAFGELAAYCVWPVLRGATPRRLREQLHRGRWVGLVFWLDDPQYLTPTTELLGWVRQYNARLVRIVLAYRLSQSFEQALRMAGAHLFLSVADESFAMASCEDISSLSQARAVSTRQEPALPKIQGGAGKEPNDVPPSVGVRLGNPSGLEATATYLLNPALWRNLAANLPIHEPDLIH